MRRCRVWRPGRPLLALVICGLLLVGAAARGDWRDAVCRLSHASGGGRAIGTGCVFGADRQVVAILTNGHVVDGAGRTITVEFFPRGQRMPPVEGRVVWKHYFSGYGRDLAVVHVPRELLGEFRPPVVRLAPANQSPRPGQLLETHGCRYGAEPSSFEATVQSAGQATFDFTPLGAQGRSGSPLVRDGRIVGVLAWGDPQQGRGAGMTVAEIHRAFRGESPGSSTFVRRHERQHVLRMPATGDGFWPLAPLLPRTPDRLRPVQLPADDCPNCPPRSGGRPGGEGVPPYTGPGANPDDEEPRPVPPGVGPVAPGEGGDEPVDDTEPPDEQPPPAPAESPPAPQPERPRPPVKNGPTGPPLEPNGGNRDEEAAPQQAGDVGGFKIKTPRIGDAAYYAMLGAGGAAGIPWLVRVVGGRLLRAGLNRVQNKAEQDLHARLAALEAQLGARASRGARRGLRIDEWTAHDVGTVEIHQRNRQVPVLSEREGRAWAEAAARMAERYPGMAATLKTVEKVKDQLLSGDRVAADKAFSD